MPIYYSKYVNVLFTLGDILLLNFTLLQAHAIVHTYYTDSAIPVSLMMVVNATWILSAIITKKVKTPLVSDLKNSIDNYIRVLLNHLLMVGSIIYFFKYVNISRTELITGYLLFFLLAGLSRSITYGVIRYNKRKTKRIDKLLIIGDESIAVNLVDFMSNHPTYSFHLVDFIADKQIVKLSFGELTKSISKSRPTEILVCFKDMNNELFNMLVKFCGSHNIALKAVPDLTLADASASVINYGNIPVLDITPNSTLSIEKVVAKRAFDIIFSTCIMIPGFPVFLCLLVITKLSSKGPAFYRQERIGKDGKPFYIYKFRSMYVDAEKFGPQLSREDDPRITPWGRFMRKTRLDELPQFWNVLIGDMAVVGPRPERRYFIDQILDRKPDYQKLLNIKPGITSIGQVNYGYAENVDEMCDRVNYDMRYLRNVNLNSDLNIIYQTVRVMIQGKGK